MKCNQIREQLNAYMDGELKGEAGKRVSAHLAYCSQCREELAALTAVDEFGRIPYVDDPGDVYWKRLNRDISSAVDRASGQRVADKHSARRRILPLKPVTLRLAGMAAAAVMVLFVGREMLEDNKTIPVYAPLPVIMKADVAEESMEEMETVKEAPAVKTESRTQEKMQAAPEKSVRQREAKKINDVDLADKDEQDAVSKIVLRGAAVAGVEKGKMYTVDGVAAPVEAVPAAAPIPAGVHQRDRRMAKYSTDIHTTQTDSLNMQIKALEGDLQSNGELHNVRQIRMKQARLHYDRAHQLMTPEAIREARLFYVVYGEWLTAQADSTVFADKRRRLDFLVRTIEEK
ncbi:zf-HC2 domain-containing protein [bacterium]|nr:zf-HC2 domain-containing protein [bacterium]